MPLISQLLTVILFTCLSFTARGEKLRIVTEPWAPYVYEENGKALGLDYETTAIVFKRLGIEVQWQFLPWKRCLSMLEQGQADVRWTFSTATNATPPSSTPANPCRKYSS